MSDKKGIERVLETLQEEGAGTALMSTIDPDLLNTACPFFEQFQPADQLMALAAMVGMALASMEGEPVPIEAEQGVLITVEERLILHVAQVRAVYKCAMEARNHPDAPKDIRKLN